MTIQHNTYFDNSVQSLGFERDGAKLSVGVMAAGEYHFGTGAPERMTVTAGELTAKLPDGDWQTYPAGSSFEIPGDSGFDVRAAAPTAYLCEYL